jgi:hypothetical protein
MENSKDHKAAAEPSLDCRVGLREAVDEIMQSQFSHSRDAMSALQRLVDAADDGAHEIERLRSELAILRDSAKDVIAWCDQTDSGGALYCIDRLRHAIAATKRPNEPAKGRAESASSD